MYYRVHIGSSVTTHVHKHLNIPLYELRTMKFTEFCKKLAIIFACQTHSTVLVIGANCISEKKLASCDNLDNGLDVSHTDRLAKDIEQYIQATTS